MPPSDFKISSGLSLFDCQDHYAILGIHLTASQKAIRKRYLRVARMLHPDSVSAGVNKQTASTLLSKLVNPSYEVLSQPSQLEEYNVLLKLIGQRYIKDLNRYPLNSNEAKELLQVPDFQTAYRHQIEVLADQQFADLNQYFDMTSTLSEMNLVYLYRQEGAPALARPTFSGGVTAPSTSAPSSRTTNPGVTNSRSAINPKTSGSYPAQNSQDGGGDPTGGMVAEDPSRPVNYNLIDQYCRRAEELIDKDCFVEAIRELKEVVEGNNPIDPTNTRVLTLLGNIYKDHMNQPVMARPFYTRALKADPNNAQAKRKLSEISPSPRSTAGGKADTKDQKKSGFFGFLSRKK